MTSYPDTSYPDASLPDGFAPAGSAQPAVRRVIATDIHPRDARGDAEGTAVRSLRDVPTKAPRPVRIGWKLGLVIDLALLSLPIPAVIVIPPLLECRHTSRYVGFFAGDSFDACAHRRIAARWKHLDSRIKMIVRGSGQ